MPKWVKLILGILLLPFCLGACQALWLVLRRSGQAETFWVAMLAGAGCWLSIYLLLPKPIWVYVFGHELTHVLWAWAFGGKVKRFKASAKGGHVVLTKSNFLVALAPYFFPLYAMAVMGLFSLGHWLFGWGRFQAWFHLLLGAAYAFHVTLTVHILQTRQSDITSQGYLFSGAVIFLGNIAVLLIGLPLLTERVSVWTSLLWWLQQSDAVLHYVLFGR